MKGKWFSSSEMANAAVWGNGYNIETPWANSTGFKTNGARYSEQLYSTSLAEEYLANATLKRHDPATETSIGLYLEEFNLKMVSSQGKEDTLLIDTIDLPDSAPLDLPLGEAMVRRRSIRNFTGDAISLEYLATLSRAASGVSSIATADLQQGEQVEFNLRTVPSGGGLYPIDIFFLALNVDKLEKGVYRYIPREDQLCIVGQEELLRQALNAFKGASALVEQSNPSVIALCIAQPWRTMRKYGELGLRFILHEAGGITQNLHLAVTGLGLGSVDCASFFHDDLHKALELDGVCHTALHAVLIGCP